METKYRHDKNQNKLYTELSTLNINNDIYTIKIKLLLRMCALSYSFCLYVCVCECLLQINLAGVPWSWATFEFPQYCASTCVRVGCTRNTSCVDTTPKKKNRHTAEVAAVWRHVIFFPFWIRTADAPITSGTHTGGGAVIGKLGSARLEGTLAMDHRINGERIHM